MTPAFDTIYSLLNALLEWADNDSFLHNTLWQLWESTEDIQSVYEEKQSRIEELEQRLENTEEILQEHQDEKEYLEENLTELSVVGEEELLDYAGIIKNAETKVAVKVAVRSLCNNTNAATDKLATLLWEVMDAEDHREIQGGLGDLRAEMEMDAKISEMDEEEEDYAGEDMDPPVW